MRVADDQTDASIAQDLALAERTVWLWRHRFAQHRLDRLEDRPKCPPPRQYHADMQARNSWWLPARNRPRSTRHVPAKPTGASRTWPNTWPPIACASERPVGPTAFVLISWPMVTAPELQLGRTSAAAALLANCETNPRGPALLWIGAAMRLHLWGVRGPNDFGLGITRRRIWVALLRRKGQERRWER